MAQLIGAAAAGLGHFVRFLLLAGPTLMLLAGNALIVYGVSRISVTAGWIASGGLLTWLAYQSSRNRPDGREQ